MYYGASPILFKYAKEMRLLPTEAETYLEKIFKTELFKEYQFRRQHPIADYIADFYSHVLKLVIEADGGIHQTKTQKQYDNFRDEDMEQFGIKVLRFKNTQILEQTEFVKQEILKAIQQRKGGGC